MTTETPTCTGACEALRTLQRHVDRMELVVDGDDHRDVRGLRQRVATLEQAVEAMLDQHAATRQRMTGLLIGVAIAGTGSVGTFAVQLARVWMGMP